MILKDDLEEQGAVLFRHRSFVPFAILPLVIVAMLQSSDFAHAPGSAIDHVYDLACILISLSGLALRGFTVATAAPRTSGRNTREQRADTLNTSGVYSVVRNPLYLANYFVFLGMLLFIREWWLVAIATLAYVMYYERIVLAEERYLLEKFGTVYLEWADRTPVMIPNLGLWVKPACRFSPKILLRREYNGFYLIVACFYLLEWCNRLIAFNATNGPMTIGQAPGIIWNVFFLAGTIIFIALRTLKKYTDVLDADREPISV